MTGIVLSAYQQALVDAVVAGKNAIVDAVAGAGKTTTSTFIARALPGKKILSNTYNRFLKEEVREKTADLPNMDVENHHSLAVIYYSRDAHTDIVLQSVLDDGVDIEPPDVDIVIYDEAQDKNGLYYRLARDFIRQLRKPVQLIFMGDRYQCLYQFKDADERYLTMAHLLWPGYEFVFLDLPESRRVPNTVAAFVNNSLLRYNRISSEKHGPKVEFIIGDPFRNTMQVYDLIKSYMGTIVPEDIFVLAPSVRSEKLPCKALANLFTKKQLPLYVSSNDEAEVRDNVSSGKAVFTSFHQAKGRERKVVVVYGMEKGYFQNYARDVRESEYGVCPSTFYVACTRAQELLIVVSSAKYGAVEFLQVPSNSWYCNVYGRYASTPEAVGPPKHNDISPTDLVRFIKPAHIIQLHKLAQSMFELEHEPGDTIDIPSLIEGKTTDTVEEVSDINGISISASWEQKHYHHCTMLDDVVHNGSKYDTYLRPFAQKVAVSYDPENMSLAATVYVSEMERLIYRPAQIPYYDWLTQYDIDMCHVHLNGNISTGARFECPINRTYQSAMYGSIKVKGRMDIVDSKVAWEIKCTQELKLEHKLQLAVYAWISEDQLGIPFKLLNIKTGEIYKLVATTDQLNTMMDILMDSKYGIVHRISDQEFLDKALSLVKSRNPATVRQSHSKTAATAVSKINSMMDWDDDD